jgi:hypothetical protein
VPAKTRIAACCALAAVSLPALPADAQSASHAKKPRLDVSALSVPAGRALRPEEEFTLRGRVLNRGKRSSRALVSLTLRTKRHNRNAYPVAAVTLARVRRGQARPFSAKAKLPARFHRAAAGRPLVVVACVRSRRGARPRCLGAERRVIFTGPTGPPAQVPSGVTPTVPPGQAGKSYTPGSRSLGDRLFPEIGNGGYDATHYDLDLDYDPARRVLAGTATITATATQDLSEYSFDLFGMPVSSVQVDGRDAAHRQELGKLIVTPPAGIDSGRSFTTTVRYGGPVSAYIDPDGSQEGWVPSSDGAFVVNEPVGAMSWYPNNNVPFDKALYDMKITVPATSTAFGNGRLVANTLSADGEKRTWHWREDSPMASYLSTATNGTFDFSVDAASNPAVPHFYGVDSAYTPVQKAGMLSRLGRSPEMLDFFAQILETPYPFTSSGGVVDRSGVGYALESQTRPMYALNNLTNTTSPSVDTISHEIAHQWFGNSVSPRTWSDIWLNEGPAEFFSWLWAERENGGPTTASLFDDYYADGAISWEVAPAVPPTAADIFDFDAMYLRGAMTMELLRQIMGEERFMEVNEAWLKEFAYGAATTADFVALVKRESGEDPARLDELFRQWLYTSYPDGEKPAITASNFDSYPVR